MKNKFLYPILFSLLLVTASCSKTISESSITLSSTSEEKPTSMQYIVDNRFEGGFIVNPASGTRMDDNWFPDDRWERDVTLSYGDSDAKPCWIVAQHGDIYSLNDKYHKGTGNEAVYTEDGYYTFFDESKVLAANPSKGALYLELNTSKEYTRDRKAKEAWCHILLNQGFEDAIRFRECESVVLTMDLLMKKFEDHQYAPANEGLHATQFLMYLVIKSDNSADANTFFWFGIPFFDNRYPNGLPESGMVDAGGAGGTGKYMYGMDSTEYIDTGCLKLNRETSVNIDLLPFFGKALLRCQREGFFTHSTIDDLSCQSMNIGFEIPGTYDCGIELSNFSLTANFIE